MDRRIEVRARVLAEPQRVPVPRRPLLVVPRNLIDRHARRRGENRRQVDDRRRRTERLREVDDLDRAVRERVGELRQNRRHDRRYL
jgi:hypothetical protein